MATSNIGTPLNMAPEILQEVPYGFEVDIWSIGVVFYQMLYGRYPYVASTPKELLENIREKRPKFRGVNISPQARDFIDKCLTVDPHERLQWSQIYSHPLFTAKNNKTLEKSTLKYRVSINKNREYYQNPLVFDPERIQNIQNQLKNSNKHIVENVQIESLKNLDTVLTQADNIKEKQEIQKRFDSLYVGKRNDLMFYCKFIQPYITSFPQIRANHATATFLLTKHSYIHLSKFHKDIQQQKNIFQQQYGFDQYTKTTNYKKLEQQIKTDKEQMYKICLQMKDTIKITSKEIKDQFKIEQLKNACYDNLLTRCLGEYCKILVEGLDVLYPSLEKAENNMNLNTNVNVNVHNNRKSDSTTFSSQEYGIKETEEKSNTYLFDHWNTKRSQKEKLIKLLAALDYLRGNEKIYSHQLERILIELDIDDTEKKMKKKYSYL